MAEEDDDKMTERWQKDAEGVILFVSPRGCYNPCRDQRDKYRPVCSRLLSQR